jgi:hypothetical protein
MLPFHFPRVNTILGYRKVERRHLFSKMEPTRVAPCSTKPIERNGCGGIRGCASEALIYVTCAEVSLQLATNLSRIVPHRFVHSYLSYTVIYNTVP